MKIKNFLYCLNCGKTRRVKIVIKRHLKEKEFYCKICRGFIKSETL